ncbi:hypothetical protein SBOR_2558 [Sclerotinia borealis F-4128]|uniref:non-specific serine/threonine protein kinase n=1 Tax=Sclerotinia borealis (strain F-4128) TaxID=1432307 RepID=W9CJV0_SCLBF|nr:hypothetical protein SBOR_2558 [Sclerotinia borealis F-4128]
MADSNDPAVKARRKEIYEDARNAVQNLRAIRTNTAPIRHNKWRKPDAGLTTKNLNFKGFIAEGGFGSVYLIENSDTKAQYALKLQELRLPENESPFRTPPKDKGAPTPPITPSSEHTKLSEKAMRERHLLTKRFVETKCYLQHIRSSHPFICNLEAFFDLRGGGEIIGREAEMAHALFFEYCDWGTLEYVVKSYYEVPRFGSRSSVDAEFKRLPKGMPPIYKVQALPEAFIWHVYMQMMEALAFLHGDHPEYNQKKEFHRRNQLVVIDIKLDNIFLKDSGVPNTYPTVKLADFGEAVFVPHGESRWAELGTALLTPPEGTWMSDKYDVWCAGVVLYMLSHSHTLPERPPMPVLKKYPTVTPIWKQFDAHLSTDLCVQLRRPLVMDAKKRPTAFELWEIVRPLAEARIPLLFRGLQNWAKPGDPLEFKEEDLKWIEEGGAPSESEKEEVEESEGFDEYDHTPDPSSSEEVDLSSEEEEDGDEKGGKEGGERDPSTPTKSPNLLKRHRREEERGKENLPPMRSKRRRLTRYRKLRAYRI